MNFTLIGTSAGNGVPSFYCNCKACKEARTKRECHRGRAAALLQLEKENILIDTPPDLGLQLERFNIERIDRVFLTHWHYDHFGGIGELEFYVRLKYKTPLPFHIPKSAEESFKEAFGYLLDSLELITYDADLSYNSGAVELCPLEATHGIETYGFLIKSPKRSIAYLPDTSFPGTKTEGKLKKADTVIMDATFNGRNWMPEKHLSLDEAIGYFKKIEAPEGYLTHISMHYDEAITNRELEEKLKDIPGVHLAYDGMVFKL